MTTPSLTVYAWPGYRLEHDRHAATVTTYYLDGTWTGGPVVPEDAEHAHALGITPLEHRLWHELAHHLVARIRALPGAGDHGCPILWRSAHGEPQAASADVDEWYVTAFCYAAAGVPMPTASHYGALIDLHPLVILPAAFAYFRWLVVAPGGTSIHITRQGSRLAPLRPEDPAHAPDHHAPAPL